MHSPDSELLVETTSSYVAHSQLDDLFGKPTTAGFVLNNNPDIKKTSPDHEGNVNCAMDIFAPDQSSICSNNSRVSSSSTLGPPHMSSCSSEPKDTSDSDRVGQFRVKLGNNYMTLLNEHDQQDAASVASDSSFGEANSLYGRGLCSPKHSPSTPTRPPAPPRLSRTSSPHFPNSVVTFPSSQMKASPKQWTVFGEDKENRLPSAERPKLLPARAPPAIPDRKSIKGRPAFQSTPEVTPFVAHPPKPSADLLTMAMDDLEFHLSDVTFQGLTPSKPAIPPRRNLFSTSSTTSGAGSLAGDSDQDLLTLPGPEGHINHAHMSSESSPTLEDLLEKESDNCMTVPPIPPRKDVHHTTFNQNSEFDSSANLASSPLPSVQPSDSFTLSLMTSSPSWVHFDETPTAPKEPPSHLFISDITVTTVEGKTLDLLDCEPADVALSDVSSQSDAAKDDDAIHWKEPSSSPDIRSSTKKKGGMGYLCLENDDCDNIGSMENIDGKVKNETVVRENDLSPEKPQSQWATFQNEDDEEEENKLDTVVDNISRAPSSPSLGNNSSGFADSLNDVDGDLEDDFGLGINRLSTDMPDLKGFNRADKGSQNNLVDFSDDRGSAAASIGSRENVDDDVETIFDLTAQGDSLKRKRRRPKHVMENDSVEDISIEPIDAEQVETQPSAAFHVGPAGIDHDAVLAEEVSFFGPDTQAVRDASTPFSSVSSRSATPAEKRLDSTDSVPSRQSISTNPFWSPTSPPGQDLLNQSSTSDSPFDNVIFTAPKSSQSGAVLPTAKPSTPIHVQLTTSPVTPGQLFRIPPPPLSQTRSSTRTKRSSLAKEKVRNLSHGSSSVKKLDLDSSSDASVRPESLPSSRADTPISATSKSDVVVLNSQTTVSGTMLGHMDDIFDPFSSNQSTTDFDSSFAGTLDNNSDNLFEWLETTPDNPDPPGVQSPSKNLFEWLESSPKQTDDLPTEGQEVMNSDPLRQQIADEFQDITLILDDLAQPDYPNTPNTEVEDHEDPQKASVIPLESDPEHEKPLSRETPDLLLELTKATSVESPNGLQVSEKVKLPEVEIVDSKTSWDVFMRFPREKRAMSNRKWVPIHVRLNTDQVTYPLVKLYYTSKVKEPFHTVCLASHQIQLTKPKLQAHYSDEGQVLGKLHSVKLMVVFYKEKQTFSPRRSIVKNASGFRHACRGKQSIKFGFATHHDVISFYKAARDAMFNVHKRLPKAKEEEHATTVKYHSRDEMLIDVCDELQAVVQESGVMEACKVRVHLFVSSFLSGDPMAKITLNDRKMEGKEVVRREDIIPSSMDGWIDVRDPELHECCTPESYREGSDENAGTCIFYPPDACKYELMRFAASYAEEELPVTIKASITAKGARLQLRCVIRMSNKHSLNKDPLTQIACEDVMIRFPVPDEWGAFFRVDGRFRNHSVRAKRAAKQRRRPSAEAGVTMEASVGIAKYERAYRAIVWRLPRLPEKNAVQNTPRVFSCRIELTSDRDLERLMLPGDSECDDATRGLDERFNWCEVEYTMPGSTASNICVRSLSLPNTDRAEKFVCYQSHYLYKVAVNLSSEPVGAEGEEDVGTTLCITQ